jgi:hypothetical protein
MSHEWQITACGVDGGYDKHWDAIGNARNCLISRRVIVRKLWFSKLPVNLIDFENDAGRDGLSFSPVMVSIKWSLIRIVNNGLSLLMRFMEREIPPPMKSWRQ